MNITVQLEAELHRHGADLVGFGDLSDLPPEIRQGLPVGVSIALKFPKDIIRDIHYLPTKEYNDHNTSMNEKLNTLAELGTGFLHENGFAAFPQTTVYVKQFETDYGSLLPHKTVATRAGIGWIGKCALLVTEELGSMIRITSLLTDAPLETRQPVTQSKCGNCTNCTKACPAGAVSGKLWKAGISRESFYNADACRETARERSMKGFGIDITKCGKCIEICPYTRRYLNEE
jgi:epoxyqueuosine reductase QueG